MDKQRKSVLDFCFVINDHRSQALKEFLSNTAIQQGNCGLAKIPNINGCYSLHHSLEIPYKGIVKGIESNDLALSSIPKAERAISTLYFNANAYSSYCKQYKEYWEWVEKRNDVRYQSTLEHGKNYDAKNMMHTFRLLHMAKEIALEGNINVRRTDRDYLLSIKNGEFEYDELVERANKLKTDLQLFFEESKLPGTPNKEVVDDLLFSIRKAFYEMKI